MSLLEIALRQGNYELAALAIVNGMLKVIHVADTLLTVISYKHLLNLRDSCFFSKESSVTVQC